MSINLFERPGKKVLPETGPEHYPTFSSHFLCFPGGLKISLWKQSCNWLPQCFPWMAFLKHPVETPGRLQGVCYSQRITQLPLYFRVLPPPFLEDFPMQGGYRCLVSELPSEVCSISLFVLQQHLQGPKGIKVSLLWLSQRHLITHTLFKHF